MEETTTTTEEEAIPDKEDTAAIKVQAVSRGFNGRQDARKRSEKKKIENQAAVRVQTIQRRATAIVFARDTKEKKTKASIHIGKIARGHSVRKKTQCLTLSSLRQGLHTVGRPAFDPSRHAYLGLCINDQAINNIDILAKYHHLQDIDLARNAISDITPLEHLPCLIRLDLADNNLSTHFVLSRDSEHPLLFPHCKPPHTWSTGHHHVGSQLRNVDLSRNGISTMPTKTPLADDHPNLRRLILDSNAISFISGIYNLSFLQVLSLAGNTAIRHIPKNSLPSSLLELNLNHCSLSYFEHFNSLTRLESLYLKENRLLTLDGLQNCTRLRILDASKNAIDRVRDVEHLSPLHLLTELNLQGNPCDQFQFYRHRVLFRLRSLAVLDEMQVTSTQMIKAINIHGDFDSDLEHRKSNHLSYFKEEYTFGSYDPTCEPWEDHLPPFVETEDPPTSEDRIFSHFLGRLVNRILLAAPVSLLAATS